ncbi:MAG: hypothetical protein EWV85_14510 [Microcystis aeruginosa Ma_QC_C_20070703_M131]|uniref:Uncharacterized protein n=1 Tax=Microcystis aeruginosa Ma_QC_C_20070703_M131 TaxID=2486263 RepID=A0A551XW25_MICAE|nr:MAG: hypothetical protein EWV85_14510 [Microcystis aeruginosa Ma_QC_C_20070703_M131]
MVLQSRLLPFRLPLLLRPRRLRPQRRFSGSLRIRENSVTLFPFFSLFTLIPYFFSFLFFPALRRVDFFEKMALMLNFIKAMKELSVIILNPLSMGYISGEALMQKGE